MQPELVETFLDLVETASFNRTAERLAVTQSTVSGRIRSLESSVGARLFDRSKAGTSLTAAGQRFISHARAMLHEWNEARRAMDISGNGERTLRIGMQNDLAANHIGEWVLQFRKAIAQTAFYIEPDYSTQMCGDLLSGALDAAVLYTPRHMPDLHYEMAGEVSYTMVSTDSSILSRVTRERYILAGYSPAFTILHRQALPHLADAPLASGQDAAICALLRSVGGSAFVLEDSAKALEQAGICQRVGAIDPISQPVFLGVNVRNRHKPAIRKLFGILRKGLTAR